MCILYRTAAHSSKTELKQAPVKSKDKNMLKQKCVLLQPRLCLCVTFFLF